MALKDKLNELLVKFNLKAVEVETEVENEVKEIVEEVETEIKNEVQEIETELEEDAIIDEAHEQAEAIVVEEDNKIAELQTEINELKNSMKDMLEIIQEMNKENKAVKVELEEKIEVVADEPTGNKLQFSAEVSETQEVELTAVEKRINAFNESYEELNNFLIDEATKNGKEIAE